MFIGLLSIVFIVFAIIWIAAISQSIKNRWNLKATADYSKFLMQFGGLFSIVGLFGASTERFSDLLVELFLACALFGVLTMFVGLISYTAIYMSIQEDASKAAIQEEELHADVTLKDEPSQ